MASMGNFDIVEFSDFLAEDTEKSAVYIEHTDDLLALVCSLLRGNVDLSKITQILMDIGISEGEIKSTISLHDRQYANDIRKHFLKKHTLRRLKNEFISQWMKEVDDICNDSLRIKKECVRILVTLPRFYEQNLILESLIKSYASAPETPGFEFKGEIEFVKKVHRKSRQENHFDYYWKTPDNHLMRFRTKSTDFGETAWDSITCARRIFVNSTNTFRAKIAGYDFYVLSPDPMSKINFL